MGQYSRPIKAHLLCVGCEVMHGGKAGEGAVVVIGLR
jgi:hypothetical protein